MLKDLRGDAGTVHSEYVLRGYSPSITEHQRLAEFVMTHFVEPPTPIKPMRGTRGWSWSPVNEAPVRVTVTSGRVMTVAGKCLGTDQEVPVFDTADKVLQNILAETGQQFVHAAQHLIEQRRILREPTRQPLFV